MPIRLEKLATSGGFGLIDIGLEKLDESLGYKEPFKKTQDIARAVAFVAGLFGDMIGLLPTPVAESLADASLPLLEKSIMKLVSKPATAGYRRVTLTPVQQRTAPSYSVSTPISRAVSF